jgi:hypothetical protein
MWGSSTFCAVHMSGFLYRQWEILPGAVHILVLSQTSLVRFLVTDSWVFQLHSFWDHKIIGWLLWMINLEVCQSKQLREYCLNELSQNFFGGTEETKTSIRIVSLWVKTQTQDFPNTKQKNNLIMTPHSLWQHNSIFKCFTVFTVLFHTIANRWLHPYRMPSVCLESSHLNVMSNDLPHLCGVYCFWNLYAPIVVLLFCFLHRKFRVQRVIKNDIVWALADGAWTGNKNILCLKLWVMWVHIYMKIVMVVLFTHTKKFNKSVWLWIHT